MDTLAADLSDVPNGRWIDLFNSGQYRSPSPYLSLLQDRAAARWVRRTMQVSTAMGNSYYRKGDQILTQLDDASKFEPFVDPKISPYFLEQGRKPLVVKDIGPIARMLLDLKQIIAEKIPPLRQTISDTPIGISMDTIVNGGAAPLPGEKGSVVTIHEGVAYAGRFVEKFTEISGIFAGLEKSGDSGDRQTDGRQLDDIANDCCDSSWDLRGVFGQPSNFDNVHRTMAESDPRSRKHMERYLFGDEVSRDFVNHILFPFVVLHELGHVHLGHTERLRRVLMEGRWQEYVQDIEQLWSDEVEADAFAVQCLRELIPDFDSSGWFAMRIIYALMAMFEVDISKVPGFRNRLEKSPHVQRLLQRAEYSDEHKSEMPVEESLRQASPLHPPAFFRFRASLGEWCGVSDPEAPSEMAENLRQTMGAIVHLGSRRYEES